MKKYKVTYLTGWRGGFGVEDSQEEIINAEDFEEAMRKANSKEWHPDAYAKIGNIEEVIGRDPEYIDADEVYAVAVDILSKNDIFLGLFGRRFLDKYISDICQEIRKTAFITWDDSDVYVAIKSTIDKKLEIED